MAALADGKIDESEIKAQEDAPGSLDAGDRAAVGPALHDQVTELLCELTVYDFMQAMRSVGQARPKSVFRG